MTKNTTYTKEEAIKNSTEYFGGTILPAEVFVAKYALRNDKSELKECTPDQMHRRLAKEYARIESKYPNPISEEEIFNLFDRFKYIIPQGSPMFGIGNPDQKSSISNCFVIDVVDSYGGICRADERIAQISKRRGGVGIDISPIRPKGLPTKNSALTTDGIVVFMERFSNTAREVAQSGRRGALMISISVHHPEIMNFIKAKRDTKKITGANISVRVSDEFMKAVQKDTLYEQRWPVDSEKPSIKHNVKAKEVWEELVKSNFMSGEPGILFWDTIINNSPADSYVSDSFATTSTNPCLTGDTLVYVADGRGNVSIKELAEIGKDVPVFCYDADNKITVQMMRNPRITGYNERIYKITLDDGSIIKCTGNHKIKTKDGEYKEAKDLVKGDSIGIITKFEASMEDVIKRNPSSRSQDYYWINNGFSNNKAEHRVIAAFKQGKELIYNQVVHHRDHDAKNNSLENLEIMRKEKHDKIHCKNMMGNKNPMRRAKKEWSVKKWEEYSKNMSISVSEDKNGRYLGITNNELLAEAIKLTLQLGYRFSKKDWQKYARKNKLPIEFSNWRKKYFGGVSGMAKLAALSCGIEYVNEDPRVVKTLKVMLEQGYDAMITGGEVYAKKHCENCGKEFNVTPNTREVCFCSPQCYNIKIFYVKANLDKGEQCKIYTYLKNKLNRVPTKREWQQECKNNNISYGINNKYGYKDYAQLKEKSEYYNHRVVSVELDGTETVYNGTVDKYHNFFIGGFKSKTKNNKNKWVYVNNKNCGELPLGNGSSCILLLLNLSSYVDNPFTDEATFNIELYKKNVRIAQRLIDDMVDLEIEAIDKIIQKVKADPEDEGVKSNELSLWTTVRSMCEKGRRTGLGITGLGDCIAMLNVKYGSEESMKIVDTIYSNLRNEAYRSSIEMAKERGSFPIWDPKKEKDNAYINRLPEDIKTEMKKYGRRNIACLTTSPAGSVSVVAQTSSGFEPVYMAEYIRKRKLMDGEKDKPDFVDASGDKWKEYKIEHHGLNLFKKITGKEFKDSPYFGAQANDINFMARVKMQAIATSYNCHAISSTINLPTDVKIEVVDNLYMSAWKEGCKGLTIYRDGSRDGVLTKDSSNNTRECTDCDEASKKLKELVQQGLRPTKVILSPAPKRPDVMECEIHRSTVRKGDWLFFVGMLNGHPYEVFGGTSIKFTIPHKYKKGWIVKNGKNKQGLTEYHLILGSLEDKEERLEIKDIAKHFNNKEYGAFTRMVSLSLRHGAPIKYICEQITKYGCAGDFFSFQRAMARILKKYIADGEVSKVECPLCKSNDMYYKNGCPTCKVCGNSSCS